MALVKFREITRAAYNNLTNKEANTQYYITETDGTFSIAFGDRDLNGNQGVEFTTSHVTESFSFTLPQVKQRDGTMFNIFVKGNGYGHSFHSLTIQGYNYSSSVSPYNLSALLVGNMGPSVGIQVGYSATNETVVEISGLGIYQSYQVEAYSGYNGAHRRRQLEVRMGGQISKGSQTVTTIKAATQEWVTANTRSNTWTPTWGQVSGKPSFAPSNAQKNSDITKAEIEAKLTGLITSHTHSAATTSAAGFMSSADKTKLNGIAAGAQKNVGTNLSQGARNTTTLRIDSSTGNNLTLPAVTTSLAGLMTSADKTKLNGIETGAQKNPTFKTVGGQSIVGSGDIPVSGSGGGGTQLGAVRVNVNLDDWTLGDISDTPSHGIEVSYDGLPTEDVQIWLFRYINKASINRSGKRRRNTMRHFFYTSSEELHNSLTQAMGIEWNGRPLNYNTGMIIPTIIPTTQMTLENGVLRATLIAANHVEAIIESAGIVTANDMYVNWERNDQSLQTAILGVAAVKKNPDNTYYPIVGPMTKFSIGFKPLKYGDKFGIRTKFKMM